MVTVDASFLLASSGVALVHAADKDSDRAAPRGRPACGRGSRLLRMRIDLLPLGVDLLTSSTVCGNHSRSPFAVVLRFEAGIDPASLLSDVDFGLGVAFS